MKYCVIIMDGAAGWPLPQWQGKTCLEIARTPHLAAMAHSGTVGLVRTIPPGMEPSSAIACMSVLGYDPTVYYKGRSGIEARSLGIPLAKGEVTFRCNLVTVEDGRMASYSSGNITTEESQQLIAAVQDKLGSDRFHFYPGVAYRHILTVKDGLRSLEAVTTPPHDISDRPIEEYLPRGAGSEVLRDLMFRSQAVLRDHPVNAARRARGQKPATMVWLFWGAGEVPELPSFHEQHGLWAAMTSPVDLLRGLAGMAGITILRITGVSDGADNDYVAQAEGAIAALATHNLVLIHVEAPDEAGHAGSIEEKVEAIERIDHEMVRRLALRENVRVLVLPDHPTPIEIRTHVAEPVPFVLWGSGFAGNGARAFTEAEAARTGVSIEAGHTIMSSLVSGSL